MTKSLGAVLISIAAALICQSCGCNGDTFPIDDYLNPPLFLQFDSYNHMQYRIALLMLKVDPEASPEQILKVLETAGNQEPKADEKSDVIRQRKVYKLLASLASPDGDCPGQLIEIFGSLLQQSRMLPNLHVFSAYLHQYGPAKLGLCAQKVNQEFGSDPAQSKLSELEAEFDLTFRAAFGLGDDKDDQLYARLREFDLCKSDFYASKMADAVATFLKNWLKYGDPQYMKLANFFQTKCRTLTGLEGTALDTVNLSVAVGGEAVTNPKFLKWNEYNRVCVSFFKQTTRDAAEANIRASLKKYSWG